MKNGLTIRDAAERWVHEMNAIPQGMIEKLMNIGDEDIHEVTEPAVGDRVYCYQPLSEHCGVIEDIYEDGRYHIQLDNDSWTDAERDDFEVEYDDALPMWGTMWSFGDSADDWWLEEDDGIKLMSECGFRVTSLRTSGSSSVSTALDMIFTSRIGFRSMRQEGFSGTIR